MMEGAKRVRADRYTNTGEANVSSTERKTAAGRAYGTREETERAPWSVPWPTAAVCRVWG